MSTTSTLLKSFITAGVVALAPTAQAQISGIALGINGLPSPILVPYAPVRVLSVGAPIYPTTINLIQDNTVMVLPRSAQYQAILEEAQAEQPTLPADNKKPVEASAPSIK